MRFIDLAAAAMIGIASVAAMVALDPGAMNANSAESAQRIFIREALFGFVESHGLMWFQDTGFPALCKTLSESSGPNVTLSAMIGDSGCGAGPPSGSTTVSLRIPLQNSDLVLMGWQTEGA